ncbi:hypothetical protein BX666DRAFT_257432 [Dichotomocladium elegans]|nr:hypothetical protein BX666DRAFT_257432 [Dichotomocladium elegans]
MRKASSVMKKTLIPGGTNLAKPSTAASVTNAGTTHSNVQEETNSDDPHDTASERRQLAKRVPPIPDASDTDPPMYQESHAELSVDFPILPSTSSLTPSGKDDKGEKLKKKARNFLDERQKVKSRAQSLWAYIDATNTFDQARFFQENAEQIFHVIYETCMHHVEKIKQRSERPQSWSSKEFVSLQKHLLLLRKMFLYVPELMRNGWQRKSIVISWTMAIIYVCEH